MLGWACVGFAIVALFSIFVLVILKRLNNAVYRLVYGMFIGGIIALYIQGNWDATDYGAWNGSEIDWSSFVVQKWTFILLFLILIIASGLISLRKEVLFSKVSVGLNAFLAGVLLLTLVVLMLTNGGFGKSKENIATTEGELEFSEADNMLILILDAYDSQAFEDLLAGDSGNQIREELADFTYYPNTIGAYSSTDMSMPLIITGSGYENDIVFGDHLDRAYEESRLMNWLDDNNWSKGVYSDILMPQGNNGFGIDNSKKLLRVASDRKALMNYMYTMVLFRYTPQPIKNHFYFYADNIKGNLNSTKGEYEPFTGDNFAFYDKIDELTTAKKDVDGTFQLIHITGAHEPFTFSEDFVEQQDETSYEAECQGILIVVDKLLNKMKEQGIYDDTVIFIMADHGYYGDRQNPLLLVKGKYDEHELAISDAAVSYYDLQDAYIDLLEERKSGEDVFNDVGGEERGRKFAYVPWNRHLNHDTYSGTFSEVTFVGGARELGKRVDEGVRYEEPEQVVIH